MSLHDYRVSGALAASGVPLYACVMAAMRRADSTNLDPLRRAFPECWDELQKRYDSPGRLLPGERDWAAFETPRPTSSGDAA